MRSADYVEMTTTSIAGTLGNGAVTCSQISSIPTFTTVFGTQATNIRYVIEDTVNKKFETGMGSVASNVLTRTRPQITWDGTTWDDSTPPPLQFGSTPTTGNILIRLGSTAEDKGSNLSGVNFTIAGDSTWRDYPISAATGWANSGGGFTLTADREQYHPYFLPVSGLLGGYQFECTTGVASSNLKSALYSCGADGLPGAKIVNFVTTATVTTGVKTDTATGSWSPAGPVWLTAGWYYMGVIASHAIGIRGNGVSASISQSMRNPLGRSDSYGWGVGAYVAGSYATGLPSVPSLGSGTMIGAGSGAQLWLGLKVTP
jgi:hypothetical protein